MFGVDGALLFQRRLGGALVGERRLHGDIALAHRAVLDLRAAVQVAHLQRQQLGQRPALLILERLVAPRRAGLPLQVADLPVDFIAHILQALQVLTRIGDARLGLAAALLVARNAGGLLDEGAHVLGLGLDDPRDHALLDDGVAARSQARAQEQLGDVPAPAARAIDVVVGAAIARYHALQRHLVVAGVGAADAAVAVVEHQLDGGRAHRLARGWSR